MKNKKDRFLRKFIIYLIFAGLAASFIYIFFNPNYYQLKAPVKFVINKGQTLNDISQNLYKEGIIKNVHFFKFAAYILNAEKTIKAGQYKIPNGLNYFQLVTIVLKGQPNLAKLITIPEGIWQRDIAKIFNRHLGIDESLFMNLSSDKNFINSLNLEVDNLEGYLLPETYYFYTDATAEDILRKLVQEQNRIFNDSINSKIKDMGMTRHQLLTMASIIDGESNIISEFPTISGVYHKRLSIGMMLQADPTIQYLIRNRKSFNRILYKDLEIDSPYNTYKYKGLPPNPINNPGKDAIIAAAFPEENDYLYFVADGKGGHNFSKTYIQHLKNVRDYRIVRNQNNSK